MNESAIKIHGTNVVMQQQRRGIRICRDNPTQSSVVDSAFHLQLREGRREEQATLFPQRNDDNSSSQLSSSNPHFQTSSGDGATLFATNRSASSSSVEPIKKPEDLADVTTELFDTLQCRSSQDGTDKIRTLLTSIPASDLDTLRADNGLTALEIAVDRKDLLAIRLLVEHGVNPNNATPGFTLATDVIRVAAERGDLELTQLLINRGVDLNVSPDGGNTPLMLAAWKGHLAIVRLMVKNGARLGLGSADGRNVLMAAMQTGKLDVIRFLLDANKSASDPFDINQQDAIGHTTLSLAYVKHGAWRRNASENEKDVQDTIFLLQNTGASKDFLLSRHDTGYGFPYPKSCIERAVRAGLGEQGDRDAKIAFVDAVKAFYRPNDTSYLSLLKNIPVKTRYEEAQDAKPAYLYDRH